MKRIDQNALYQNLCGFLKAQGITLGEGRYAQGVQQSCGLLADVINATQETLEQAKGQVDQQLEQLRQSIHEATAPKSPPSSGAAAAEETNPNQTKPRAGRNRTPKAAKTARQRRKKKGLSKRR